MFWFWLGLAILLSTPTAVALWLVEIHFWLKWY